MKLLLSSVAFVFILSSCSSLQLTKRVHRKGYHTEWAFFKKDKKKSKSETEEMKETVNGQFELLVDKAPYHNEKTVSQELEDEPKEKITEVENISAIKTGQGQNVSFLSTQKQVSNSDFFQIAEDFRSAFFKHSPKRTGPIEVGVKKITLMVLTLALGIITGVLAIDIGTSSGQWSYIAGGIFIMALSLFLCYKIIMSEDLID